MGTSGIGARTLLLPKGYHWLVEPNSDLVMETHFRPDGRPHALLESVALIPAPEGASRGVQTVVSMVRMVQVPEDAVHTVSDVLVLEHDVDVVGLTPRAQGVCTSMSITAIKPNGCTVLLGRVSPWDPHWRRMVVFEQPIRLRAGTKLRSSWTLENTASNPRNPFIPLAPYTLAQRTGAVAWLLHVAAVEPEQDDSLQAWGVSQLRARQR